MEHRLAYLCSASFVLGAATGMAVLVSSVSGRADRSISKLEERLAAMERAAAQGAPAAPQVTVADTALWRAAQNAMLRELSVHLPTLPAGAEPFEFNGMTYYNMPLRRGIAGADVPQLQPELLHAPYPAQRRQR